jgi:hypothetical protein
MTGHVLKRLQWSHDTGTLGTSKSSDWMISTCFGKKNNMYEHLHMKRDFAEWSATNYCFGEILLDVFKQVTLVIKIKNFMLI